MKRLIKYWSPYNEIQFSNCSTKYEVLPHLVPDNAGPKVLSDLAKQLGLTRAAGATVQTLKTKNQWESKREQFITHSLELRQTAPANHRGNESYHWKIGFITINETRLPAVENCKGRMTKDLAFKIVDGCYYSASNTCEIDGEYMLVIESWNYFHSLNLLGYSLEKFEKCLGIDSTVFDDSVSTCSGCGEYNYNDNGRTYNFRSTPDGEYLGLECGCFDSYSKENIEAWANNSDTCVEPEAVEKLVEDGAAEFIQRYVGGMTDSWRSHSYGGEAVSIGEPKEILKNLLSEEPNGKFIFCHDESGQFQTYFSVYRLLTKEN